MVGCGWMVCKDMLMSGNFGVLKTKLDGTKCSNKYKMFLINIRKRLKVIPSMGQNDLKLLNQPKQDVIDMRYMVFKNQVFCQIVCYLAELFRKIV